MSTPDIKWNPQGFAECLQSLSGEVQAAAEQIATRADSYLENGSGFHVEMANEARFNDSSHGVTRPVAYVVTNDEETDKEEAEYKVLSKALR